MTNLAPHIDQLSGDTLIERYGPSLSSYAFRDAIKSVPELNYLTLQKDGNLLGVVELEIFKSHEYLGFIETSPDARNQGHSHILLKAAFAFSSRNSGALLISSLTTQGQSYLLRHIERLKQEHPEVHVEHARFC